MSWDSYIDNLIAHTKDASGTPQCDRACIIGLDGSIWTTESHPHALELTAAEAGDIGRVMKSEDMSPFMAAGITAALNAAAAHVSGETA